MEWEVAQTDAFESWWEGLTEPERESVLASVGLVRRLGPRLGHPHSSQIKSSDFGGMRELRVQHKGRPLRILYAFDTRRTAVLLLGGDKKGNDRWYRLFVPQADQLFQEHLKSLIEEKGQNGS